MQALELSKFRTLPYLRIPQKKDKKWVFLWVSNFQLGTACFMMGSTDVLLIMIEEEEWGYLNDWEEDQLRKKRTKICMCCDHFRYACTVQCVTLLTCPVHQKLIPQGDHLIKGCKYWVKRRELREGWCPEVALKWVC